MWESQRRSGYCVLVISCLLPARPRPDCVFQGFSCYCERVRLGISPSGFFVCEQQLQKIVWAHFCGHFLELMSENKEFFLIVLERFALSLFHSS